MPGGSISWLSTLAFCSLGAGDARRRRRPGVSLDIRWETPSKVGDDTDSSSMRFSLVYALSGTRGVWSSCARCLRRACRSSSKASVVSSAVACMCDRTTPEDAEWKEDWETDREMGVSSAVERTEPIPFLPRELAEVLKEER